MNKMAWLQTAFSLLLVMRVVLFERFEQAVLIGWWLLVGSMTLIFYWFDYRVSLGIIVVGLLLLPLSRKVAAVLKPKLLRSGDTIEFVMPERDLSEQFSQALLIGPIPKSEVLKRKLFDPEQADAYARFYLVAVGKKSRAIPYEWIMGIELNELPLP